jgi:hypothetical protein
VITKRLYMTFGPEIITRPVIYEIVKQFDVIPNIRSASIHNDIGLVSMEITGTAVQLEETFQYLRKLGVRVDPVEMNVVES